jgi:urease gamma subunit
MTWRRLSVCSVKTNAPPFPKIAQTTKAAFAGRRGTLWSSILQRKLPQMLEFDTNTLAFMTAALEHACKKLKIDTPEARKFVADKLIESAKSGRKSIAELIDVGEQAAAETNVGEIHSSWWRNLIGT